MDLAIQDKCDTATERIAVKILCASDALKNIVETASQVEIFEKKVVGYVRQINLALALKRGNASMQMVGSMVKTVGAFALIGSTFVPKLRTTLATGEKLWRLGAGLKIISAITEILKHLWSKGCRKCLMEFTKHTAKLVKNLRVFNELVTDLRHTVDETTPCQRLFTSEQVLNAVSTLIPDSQRVYISHILCIVLGGQGYSPLFDFAALTTNPSSESNVLRLIQEIESLRFLQFAQESDSKEFVAIGTFLHVTRELIDFLDGFHKLTDSNLAFLKDCLVNFTEECVRIKMLVSFLLQLKDMKTDLKGLNVTEQDEQRNL